MPWIRTTVCASALMSASPVVSATPDAVISQCAGQREPHIGAAGRAVRRVRFAAVRTGDGLDDGEPEAAPVLPSGIDLAEALERAREERLRESFALVEDVQLDAAVAGRGRERDQAAAVAQRVVDHVGERLVQAEGVRV